MDNDAEKAIQDFMDRQKETLESFDDPRPQPPTTTPPFSPEELRGISSPKLTVLPEFKFIPGSVTVAECGCGVNLSGPLHQKVLDSFDQHRCFREFPPSAGIDVTGEVLKRFFLFATIVAVVWLGLSLGNW